MNDTMLTGSLMDEIENMTLDELAGICSCKTEWIIELVNEGILEPRGQSQTEWRFSGNCLLRTRTAYRLYQDLQINVAGIALVIDLVDEVNDLQARLRVFESQ
jgi:chaperone modulatory protein CbpM